MHTLTAIGCDEGSQPRHFFHAQRRLACLFRTIVRLCCCNSVYAVLVGLDHDGTQRPGHHALGKLELLISSPKSRTKSEIERDTFSAFCSNFVVHLVPIESSSSLQL